MATSMEIDDDELIESEFSFDDHEPTAAPLCDPPVLYSFDEVEIKFPKTAYLCQEQIMQILIRALKNGENCLLESPTGTGKTLALLCPILAWLYKGDQEGPTYWDVPDVENGPCTCDFDVHEDCTVKNIEKPAVEWELRYPLLARVRKVESQDLVDENGRVAPVSIEDQALDIRKHHEVCRRCRLKFYKSEKAPPKVYYTTRTVSQSIGNLRQLLATHYRKDFKGTILASRANTCIEENIMKARKFSGGESVSVDDECTMRRNNFHYNQKQLSAAQQGQQPRHPLCNYFQDFDIMKQKAVEYQNSKLEAVDIEDLRKDGKDLGLCPYYLASFMHEGAEIVFCTYNYLLDESIRRSSKIDLLNSVVVFDEAHNIEDTCRTAASKNLSLAQLSDAILKLQDCLKAAPNNSKGKEAKYRSNVSALESRLQSLQSWVEKVGEAIPLDEFKDSASKEFHTDTIKEMLTKDGSKFCVRDLDEMTDHLYEIYYLESDGSGSDGTTALSSKVDSKTIRFIRHLVNVLKFLVDPSRKDKKIPEGALTSGSSDFVICFEKTRRNPVKTPRQQDQQPMFNYAFKIICLNPAIAFDYIKKVARTIIVASGTLHPMEAFQSELATPFPEQNRLSAKHVVPQKNVWVGVFHKSSRPNGPSLNLSKRNQDCTETLDEVGAILLQICDIVSFGVLVFVPSYEFLTTLQTHWSKTPPGSKLPPVLDQLKTHKSVFYESKNEQEFTRDPYHYKKLTDQGDGAIYFGVFRGKVSEGVDFADNQARAVITLGIPHLNLGSAEVKHKMDYNDVMSRLRDVVHGYGHIGGSRWYSTQGFRALNQAFGRVIRHQNDWGAICIIEERLRKDTEQKHLPDRVRERMRTLDVDQNMESLRQFMREKMKQA